MKSFRPHGEFALKIFGNILEMQCKGSWNKETANQAVDSVLKLINENPRERYAMLFNMNEWDCGTPEFQNVISERAYELVDKGITHEAYIFTEGGLKRYQLTNMMPDDESYEGHFFCNYMDALTWLHQEGFSLLVDE
ncbi:hypothetical protein EYS14_21205 [Alteromonadaceae bacterium M269]|nr:hypothetical protein EYS14_21205 [Alteromonadaceae bacterium M269]